MLKVKSILSKIFTEVRVIVLKEAVLCKLTNINGDK